MEAPINKEPELNLSLPQMQKKFVQDTSDATTLLRKELDVNLAEQQLLQKRMDLMKSLINDLPSSDPQYSMLLSQIGMDQIEQDELKNRARAIEDLIEMGGSFRSKPKG